MATPYTKENAMNSSDIQDFINGYMECAVWSSTDDNGEPLDKKGFSLTNKAKAAMKKDCKAFLKRAKPFLVDENRRFTLRDFSLFELAGHDFWLTRNGHGAGFWDGDWEDSAGVSLTEIAKSFGECNLYDYRRKIHVYG